MKKKEMLGTNLKNHMMVRAAPSIKGLKELDKFGADIAEEKETVNKVNIPEAYQKNEVMPERNLNKTGNIKKKETVYFKWLKDKNDYKILKKGSIEEQCSYRYRKPLDRDTLGSACDLWIKKVTKFRKMVKKKKNNKPKEVSRYLDNCELYEIKLEKNYEKEALENYQKVLGIEITNEIIVVEINCEKNRS
ncbi:29484_t:CDS:2 [Gigaspora margarita]|uniref:29484_t:CDS:1 n=1 Tax=Gigaspora margarita TaxID=4874 RepID=A0ABN7VJP2_GIGMA|nr:29484_t:CDS:2 [Gigaspora margarita]